MHKLIIYKDYMEELVFSMYMIKNYIQTIDSVIGSTKSANMLDMCEKTLKSIDYLREIREDNVQ